MFLLIAAAWLLVSLLAAAVAYRALFACAWLLAGRSRGDAAGGGSHRFAVVVPAHDEELLIADLLRSVRDADYPADLVDVHVIADNCSDRTAEVVREHGEQAAERHDPDHPGKGQALDWMFRRLDLAPYDAVVLLDADNLVDPRFFQVMSHELAAGARCLQGYYDIANPDESTMTRMLAVTYVMKNLFFNAGKRVLGLSSVLCGTGMVFHRGVIQTHGWQAMTIGEDLEQTVNLVSAGEHIAFVADARIRAQESTTLSQGYAQRQRWASGRRALARSARALLVDGLRRRSLRRFDVGIDLLLPNYARLLSWSLAAFGVSVLLRGAAPGLVWAAGTVLAYQALEVGAALLVMRPGPRFLVSLTFAPVFLVWRLGIDLLSAFGHRKDVWARTDRKPHAG